MKPESLVRGFSLLELLVVIVILGVTAGMVSLSVAPSEERLVATEMDRLAALFRLAQSESRVSGRPLVWKADGLGYRCLAGDVPRGERGQCARRGDGGPCGGRGLDPVVQGL